MLCGFLENAIHRKRVEMDVEIQTPAESLWKSDGARFRARDAGALLVIPCDFLREDPLQCAEHVRLDGCNRAEFER